MKILFVSYYAPPYNCMGSIRMLKIVSELRNQGHEVVIVAGEPNELEQDLQKLEQTIFVPHFNLRCLNPKKSAEQDVNNKPKPQSPQKKSNPQIGKLKNVAVSILHNTTFPDLECFWYWAGKRNLRSIAAQINSFDGFEPDVVYASCLPVSSGALANKFAEFYKVPLVLEFRDKWANSPYRYTVWLRELLEKNYEKKLINKSSGVIGVTKWLSNIGDIACKPKEVVFTGIELSGQDKSDKIASKKCFSFLDKNKKLIVYTGMVYPGKRDPSKLIQVFNNNIGSINDSFQLVFAGRNFDELEKLSQSENVFFLGQIKREVALQLQSAADLLLLLTWDNKSEAGNISGKVFEYLESGTPILHLGYTKGEAAELVELNGLSLRTDSEVEKIADAVFQLKGSSSEQNKLASITTSEQVKKLTVFIDSIKGS